MFNRRMILAAGATLVAATAATSAFAQDWKAKYPELTFAVVPAENASGVSDRFAPFLSYLSKELGVPVKLRVAQDYAAVIEGQRAGNIHIANYGPASFARARMTGVNTEVFATDVSGNGSKGYYSVFFVKAKSPYPEDRGPQGQESRPRRPELHLGQQRAALRDGPPGHQPGHVLLQGRLRRQPRERDPGAVAGPRSTSPPTSGRPTPTRPPAACSPRAC